MKCPHCGQEHPDNFKFCPNTAKAIETQLKACTNKNCPDCGKFILPIDSKFCPTCGSSVIGKSDSSDVFLSFFDIVLGVTNIYDVDADEYAKSESPLFGEVITVKTNVHGNDITLVARLSDRKIFSITIENKNELVFPNSWISVGVKPCNVMLSMEQILGRNDFTWKELKQNDESVGIAFKGIGNDMYIFIFVTENYVTIMKIQEEAKNNLYEDLTKIYKIVTEKTESNSTKSKMESDDINKVNGRYRWQTDSFLKKIEEDKKAREQLEFEKSLKELERLKEERKRQETREREAMIEKWRRKHGK